MPLEAQTKMNDSLKSLALAIVYFGAAKWGLSLAFVQANVTAVWPPTGIALAALLIGGWRLWPGVFLGAFCANLSTQGTAATSLGIAAGNTLEALLGFYLISRFARGNGAFRRTADLFKFAILGGLIAPLVSATVGVTSLALGGMTGNIQLQDAWFTWWLGDMGGALLVAPPILLFPRHLPQKVKPLRVLEAAVFTALLFIITRVLFGGKWTLSLENHPVQFLFFPFLLWAAARFGPFGASLAILALSLFSIQGTLHGLGPFHGHNENQSLLFLQGFMGMTAVTILALACGIEERRRAEENLRWSHSDLQLRVLERTEELQKANLKLGREVEERRRLSLLVETSSDFICLVSMEGHMLYLNGEGRRLVGLGPKEDITPRLHGDFIVPEEVPRLQNEMMASLLAAGHWKGEFQLRHFTTGAVLPFHFTAVLIKDPATGEPQAMAAIGRDLTRERRSEKYFRALIENALDIVTLLDDRGTIVFESPSITRILGYSPTELNGTSAFAHIHPEDVAGVQAIFGELLQKHGKILTAKFRFRHKDGSWNLLESIGTNLLSDPAIKGIVVNSRDVTREEEARRAAMELDRSNRELEQFAYVASHDLQEPLRMVTSFVQLLARKYRGKLDEEADQYIHETVEGASRMRALILDLLAYSRVDSVVAPFEPVDCAGALNQALLNLAATLKDSGAEVSSGDLPFLWGDFNQVVQLFQNLVGNAVKFHGPEPPEIRVEAQRKGEDWIFCVRDNGIGIDPRYSSQIFEVFKRLHTRSEYPGTGIGLAICKKVVTRHGGRIWVESEPGKGSAFYWSIPVVKEAQLETRPVS